MSSIHQFLPGNFCWADLFCKNIDAAAEFYSAVFGWKLQHTEKDPINRAVFLRSEKPVCGIQLMTDRLLQGGIPSHWLSVIAVENIDVVIRNIESLGGKNLVQPTDISATDRRALVQDPTGAVFSLWQTGEHTGASEWNRPNSLCWNELYSNNIEQSLLFYRNLFGWTHSKSVGAIGQDYFEFIHDGRSVGGMMEIRKEWGDMPPCWSVYFSVDNIHGSITNIRKMGGTVEGSPMEIENVGQFAVVMDPEGAFFSILQFHDKLIHS